MFRHILTATDGSDWARKGVDVAIDMAAALKAKLTVIMAAEAYPDQLYADGMVSMTAFEGTRKALEARAHEVLEEIAAAARAKGVEPHRHYLENVHPGTAIVETAADQGCDLIVIGSRGRRGLTKLLLGSQAAEVLAGTKLPVMIVK